MARPFADQRDPDAAGGRWKAKHDHIPDVFAATAEGQRGNVFAIAPTTAPRRLAVMNQPKAPTAAPRLA